MRSITAVFAFSAWAFSVFLVGCSAEVSAPDDADLPDGGIGDAVAGPDLAGARDLAVDDLAPPVGDLAPPADLSFPPDLVPIVPEVLLPRVSIVPDELGIVVNDADPQSQQVADYYRMKRGIPANNVFHVSFPIANNVARAAFMAEHAKVEALAGTRIQAYALTWMLPYKVDCMSISSAFALGFDTKYCKRAGAGCQPSTPVSYYDSASVKPFDDHQLRPTMVLFGVNLDEAKRLVDRGVAADGSLPVGDGHLIRTTDVARSVRWSDFQAVARSFNPNNGIRLLYVDNSAGGGSNTIQNQKDVLFYFTGLVTVANIATNTYLPGAIADHLTSFGGALPGGGQMPVTKWLEAGVTASYGTVVEPCNFTGKFPVASKVIHRYFRGATAIEAYWKSVQMPGEGIFVGEPLARPFGKTLTELKGGQLTLRTTWLDPAWTYAIEAADNRNGPWDPVLGNIRAPESQWTEITVPNVQRAFYRLVQVP